MEEWILSKISIVLQGNCFRGGEYSVLRPGRTNPFIQISAKRSLPLGVGKQHSG